MIKVRTILLVLVCIFINVIIYNRTENGSSQRIKLDLEKKLNTLETHYRISEKQQKMLADISYKYAVGRPEVINILRNAQTATDAEKIILRKKLSKLLEKQFKRMKIKGMKIFQFVLPNNESFLRMHKQEKYGDDVSRVRYSFRYVNKTKKQISGFEQGKTSHAFRYVYPIFDNKDNQYLGAVELSYKNDYIEDSLMDISDVHTHFIVDKRIFDANIWEKDEVKEKFTQSAEDENYALSLGKIHTVEKCVVHNAEHIIKEIKTQIKSNILKGKKFYLYNYHDNRAHALSFYPIQNIKDKKTVAWFMTYEESELIEQTLKSKTLVRAITFIVSLILFYFIYRNTKQKEELQVKTNEQTNLLSLFDKGDSVLFKWENDEHWSIEYVSQSVSRLLGYTQDEFLNGDIVYADCIDKNYLQTVMEEVEEGSKPDKNYFQHKPYRLITKNSEVKWVLDYTVVLRDKDDNITHYLGYITDITQQKESERLIAEQSKLVSMGEMIGNIAHQWRQPLSVISSSATGMLIQKELNNLSDEQFIKTCNSINDNAQYLSKTIDDFRDFIKGDRKVVEFKLSDDIERFLHLVEGSIKSNDIKIIKDIDENITINGYPNELAQCFINIFNNSKDTFKEKGENERLLFISTDLKDDKAIITFKDNAGGIPDDILPKVFEPYFTTKHQSQGTGLGLHMTYNLIVDGMNGTIEAHNLTYEYKGKKYTGAEFKIILPLK